jgi:hypothetical protein
VDRKQAIEALRERVQAYTRANLALTLAMMSPVVPKSVQEAKRVELGVADVRMNEALDALGAPPDVELGERTGEVLAEGAQFSISYTPHRGGHPNVTLWSEDDENWFFVNSFAPSWLMDLQRVCSKAFATLDARGLAPRVT